MSLKQKMINKTEQEILDMQKSLDSHREDLDYADDHNNPHEYGVICNIIVKLIKEIEDRENFLKFLKGK